MQVDKHSNRPHQWENDMPYWHQTKQKHPGGDARRVPLALAASLTVLLAACGSGSDDPSQAGSMTRMAAKVAVAETVLTPVNAVASASERGDLDAKAAIDHDDNTRWSSGFTDDQTLTLDFGDTKQVNRVRINWENAHAIAYLLQVSDDNVHWTTIKSVTDSVGGVEDFTDLDGKGRYLRMQGVKRSTQYGYSIFEIQAYSGGTVTPPATPDPLPGDIDLSKPGVGVKPVDAFSSAVENNANAAGMAIDGNGNTRWSSKAEDGAWITFDFGAKTPVGYMKLVWENAYGKEYEIRASDDGQTWSRLRYVSGGTGGTEEILNLNANARYIQLQGVARATQYGYSLFEVEFKTPGSDNTLPSNPTSALKYPASGNGWTPLPAAARPTEMLQFSLPDGTLVTRYGARAMARHGRERGEAWNEIGYGLNETVDPATGLPLDKGPGNYLTFVPEYFQNRTWGLEIIDNSRVKGVTNPQLIINNYNLVEWKPGQTVFVRRWDAPDVTDYGWMTGPLMQDNDIATCKPMAYPLDGVLTTANGINNGCTMKLISYPQHGEINTAGFPTGKTIPARALVVGDEIEIAPSMFAQDGALAAIGDKGNSRYYGPELMYVMGKGIMPYYGTFPRLNSTPLPDATLSGGTTSVSYNYSDNSLFMFQQPANNIGMQDIQRFVEGRRLIHANFTTGAHNEPGNDPYLPVAGLQGTHFNQSACIGCHTNNGRSPAPNTLNQKLDAMAIRVAALDANGVQVPHPQYGTALQMNGNAGSTGGATRNWGTTARVGGFTTETVKLADGTAVELRKPSVSFEGPTPAIYSLRSAQPMIGTGLLEAVPEADILARVRTTADADGVKGVANFVYDPESGAVRLGRFGWKAAKATLRHQSAEALLLDMGVTSPIYPNRACMNGPAACASGGAQAGIAEADLQKISGYLALLAVPAQRSLASGFPKGVAPMDEHRVDPAQVAAGAKLFDGARCTACHAVEMKTGNGHLFAELRNQTIHPYTDLLVHDMGTGLADKFAEGQAAGSMWRTSPLWGIGYTDKVMGSSANVGYLHDGRARNLTEAVMWHGGEALAARNRFATMSKTDRDSLLAFLRSL
jgi:CxxC motif-containing protein (DUF1111 family)